MRFLLGTLFDDANTRERYYDYEDPMCWITDPSGSCVGFGAINSIQFNGDRSY